MIGPWCGLQDLRFVSENVTRNTPTMRDSVPSGNSGYTLPPGAPPRAGGGYYEGVNPGIGRDPPPPILTPWRVIPPSCPRFVRGVYKGIY